MPGVLQIDVSLKSRQLQTYEFDRDEVTVGRGADADIVIDNAGVSRCHATIERRHEAFVLRDLGSANGTFVNESRVEDERTIEDGDVVRIGKFSLEVNLVEEARGDVAAPAPPPAQPGLPDGTIMLSPQDMASLRDQMAEAKAQKEAEAAAAPPPPPPAPEPESTEAETESPAAVAQRPPVNVVWLVVIGSAVGSAVAVLGLWFLLQNQ